MENPRKPNAMDFCERILSLPTLALERMPYDPPDTHNERKERHFLPSLKAGISVPNI